MNLIWNKNIELFKKRFSSLAALIDEKIAFYSKYAGTEAEKTLLHPFWEVTPSKAGDFTASENSLKLHSSYNPVKEALTALSAKENEIQNAKALIFCSFGLGYTPCEAAKLYPAKTIILIEPDINYFLSAMLFTDFESLLTHQNVIFACGATPDQAITLINQYGISNSAFFSISAQTSHAEAYYSSLSELIRRNKDKEDINNATLEKFRKLWLSNSRKNISKTALLESVNMYKNQAASLPFLVLGAGPSLEKILPHLQELKNKVITVCVDTALRACLQYKYEPDFIVLTDPQFWAYKHIAGLKSPSSILIIENAVYPAVLSFECRKIVCCQSQIPVGSFFEKYCGPQGYLGAGGSVASCAWSFAKLAGASSVYLCGLDLSFPKKKTHIKGSTFEQKAHSDSTKISPSETKTLPMLFSGNVSLEKDYSGNPLLSDQRMKMFAWWFESNIASSPETKTYTLSPEGLYIPGVKVEQLSTLQSLPDLSLQKNNFLSICENQQTQTEKQKSFEKAKKIFNSELTKALNIATDALNNSSESSDLYKQKLSQLQIANLLALIPPTNLSTLPESHRHSTFFSSIKEFAKSYYL